MLLFCNGRGIGIFYADFGDAGSAITPHEINHKLSIFTLNIFQLRIPNSIESGPLGRTGRWRSIGGQPMG